ncbi:MAG: hypothetical protein IH984_04150 [Planctomycetes bacterium]|nr:hypothetical protein [Planctomycetota bacterium]
MKNILLTTAVCSLIVIWLTGCHRSGITISNRSNSPSHQSHGGPPDHAPAHGFRKKHQYHYYPNEQVYYAPASGTYFWLEGSNWRFGVNLPGNISVNIGDRISIELDTDKPYQHHYEVSTKHPSKGKGKGRGRGKGKGKGKGKNH